MNLLEGLRTQYLKKNVFPFCYGDIPYPKDGIVQPKHILRASSLGEENFSFLRRHLTDRLQAENG